jgi:DNA topoisomerase VI subunit A
MIKLEKKMELDLYLKDIETVANYPFKDHNFNTLTLTQKSIKKAKELLKQEREQQEELTKAVKEYFEVKRKFYIERQSVKYALRIVELEETIKEMVGV